MSDHLPVEVLLSIQRVLNLENAPESDPFDALAHEFSLEDVLNEFFPAESSLGSIDQVQARLADNERDVRHEIEELKVQLKQNQDPEMMLLIQETISDLLGQISLIREKASESEAVVRDITKDIQALNVAKKNLVLSMTTLERLQMLVEALTQLESLVEEKKYPEIAHSLSAIKQLSPTFQSYTSVPTIAQLWTRIRKVEGHLRAKIESDFDHFFAQTAPIPTNAQMLSACLVVDVLPVDVRASLVARHVAKELKDYRRIFRVTGGSFGSNTSSEPNEAAALDNIERRFAWLRRLLGKHETDSAKFFPEDWKVGWALVAAFIDITRDDMSTLLSKAATAGKLTVKILLDTLAIVAEFEGWVVKKFASPLQEVLSHHASSPSIPPKSILTAFEPHMGIFVDAQDKALADMLSPHLSKSNKPRSSLDTGPSLPEDSAAAVLPSSTELFYFYGQSLEQCVKLGVSVGTGKAMFDLASVWKKWLRIYSDDVLLPRLKRPALSRRSTDTRWDVNEIREACLVVNTADYCSNTASELEMKIKEKIQEEYREQVSMQVEKDLFLSVISSSINVLLKNVDAATDSAFNTMARTSYATHSQVSGPSPWTGELISNVEAVVGDLKSDREVEGRKMEGKKYMRNFLDKACSLILARFTVSLVKSRPLGQGGAEQLLIDLQAVKACLSKLPGESLITPSYARGLAKTTSRLEALLKVIVTPDDPPEGFILNYTLLIGDASFSNFQKILDLKGTAKASQGSLLDLFVTIASTKPELESTSFLSSLDMDPTALSHLAAVNVASPSLSRPSLPAPAGENVSGPSTGDSAAGASKGGDQEKEKFLGFKRLVSFGLRRDSQPLP